MPIHTQNSPHAPRAAHAPGVAPLLRVAKRLHRAAVSSSLAESLPVLRRLLAAQVIRGLTLPQLSQRRSLVQRKHLLQTLAIEAGFLNWDAYRGALAETPHDPPLPFDVHTGAAGYPNLWFSSLADAEAHAARHGGRAVRHGQQAVVFVEDVSAAI